MHYKGKNWGTIAVKMIGFFLPQTNSILLFWDQTTVQNFIKIVAVVVRTYRKTELRK